MFIPNLRQLCMYTNTLTSVIQQWLRIYHCVLLCKYIPVVTVTVPSVLVVFGVE